MRTALSDVLEPVGGTGIDDHAQFPLTIDEELRKARFRRAIASCPQIGIEAEELPGIPRVIGVFERSLRIMNSQCRTRRIAPAQYLTLWCSRTIVGAAEEDDVGWATGVRGDQVQQCLPGLVGQRLGHIGGAAVGSINDIDAFERARCGAVLGRRARRTAQLSRRGRRG